MTTTRNIEHQAPELSIIIPVFNEATIVRSSTEELARSLDKLGYDYELILAENGSLDGTREIVDELSSEIDRVRCLHENEPNYGRALRSGIMLARGSYVICDEIDLCDTDFYARALPILRSSEADMVVGSKACKGANDERPLLRRAGTKAINNILRLTLGFQGTDTHGLKAFKRENVAHVAKACVVERDMFASELVIRAGRMGCKILEIPVRVREKRRPTINLTRRVPNVLKNVLRLIYVFHIQSR